MPNAQPSVAIVIPVLDEVSTIGPCLDSIAAQDYQVAEVIIADGGSTDGTLDLLSQWANRSTGWRVIRNPRRRQSPGINLAVAEAKSDVIVRMDAHTTYAPDYVGRSVTALLETGAVAVGGPMRPVATRGFGRAVAAAMRIPLLTGPARFHRDDAAGEADTVYLGTFRRSDFVGVGGLRSFPSGAGEDADLYHRWRRQGAKVWLDPTIVSEYRPRGSVAALFRQHFRYGQAKAEMLWVNGSWPSWRPLAPGLLFGALVGGGVFWIVLGTGWPLAAVGVGWLALLVGAAWRQGRLIPLVVLAGAVMHLAYGLGLWWGLIRGPRRVRRSVATV